MDDRRPTLPNRGTPERPPGRFERLVYQPDPETVGEESEGPRPRTVLLRDETRAVISISGSPDLGFRASLNPYRGCEHGCSYCYARPTHEYLGFSAGLDFETRILVKERAPDLLREELASRSWQPQLVALSGVTDAYQPIEARLGITRRCLEVLAEFRNPVAVITKNALVERDIDVLSRLAAHRAAAVFVSMTTLEVDLWKRLEPRTSRPERRLEAIRALTSAGIPTGVMVAPVIPGLNDHEIPAIVASAAAAGATRANRIVLRLPYGLKDLFSDWLDRHAPDRKGKVLSRIRAVRGGQLNDTEFGRRMTGEGIFADQIRQLLELACRRAGIEGGSFPLSTESFRRPGPRQLDLFER